MICIFNIIQMHNLVIYLIPFNSVHHHELIFCQYLTTYFITCNCTYEVCTGFCLGNLRERDYLQDPGVDGDNINMAVQEVGCGCMDWIDLARDRDMWPALVNAVMNLRVP